MKKDIPNLKVKDVGIAIIPGKDMNSKEEPWDVFLINLKRDPLKNVLVNSRGYGELEGKQKKTTILRHFFERIGPRTAVQIEPIQPALFALANEYWVSFVHELYMFDKKYVFVKGSIGEYNLSTVPIIERKGVLIL